MRRTPLFGFDGNLGIPIIPSKSKQPSTSNSTSSNSNSTKSSSNSQQKSSSSGKQKSNTKFGSYSVPHTDYSNSKGSTSSTSSVGSNSSTGSMEVSTRNGLNGKTVTPVNTSNSAAPGTPNRHVNFGGGTGEEKKREKFLTAKYGAHQMALIRKRLRVEMWMYERLTEIYGSDDIEIDLDEVLDMEDEAERRTYIIELLRIGSKRPLKVEHVNLFVGDLLEKVKTL